MLYKSILNAVAVAVAVMAVMFVGCGGDDNPSGGGGGGGLVGDWAIISERYENSDGDNDVWQIPDNMKVILSFKSSGNVTFIEFQKFGDFWLESVGDVDSYRIKGDSVCNVWEATGGGEYWDCQKYSISGNTLTLSYSRDECYVSNCYTYSITTTLVRANLASTRSSFGKVYSRNPLLEETDWYKENVSGYRDQIHLCTPAFDDYGSYYISFRDNVWYTEGDRIIILELECGEPDRNGDCIYYPTGQSVTLEYQLTGEILRLRPAGTTEWDVWISEYDYYKSQSKAKAHTGKRAVSPFKAFRR